MRKGKDVMNAKIQKAIKVLQNAIAERQELDKQCDDAAFDPINEKRSDAEYKINDACRKLVRAFIQVSFPPNQVDTDTIAAIKLSLSGSLTAVPDWKWEECRRVIKGRLQRFEEIVENYQKRVAVLEGKAPVPTVESLLFE